MQSHDQKFWKQHLYHITTAIFINDLTIISLDCERLQKHTLNDQAD